jgi:hypothetical protein
MSRSIGIEAFKEDLQWLRLAPSQPKRQAAGVPSIALDGTCRVPEAPVPNRLSLCLAVGTIATALMVANAKAQDAEPRSYTNTPVGLNFLLAGYGYSQGKIAFDPTLSIADAQFHAHTEALAYVRSLDVWGKSAKFDASSISAGRALASVTHGYRTK